MQFKALSLKHVGTYGKLIRIPCVRACHMLDFPGGDIRALNMIRYGKLYLRAPKRWRVSSLIRRTEPEKSNEKKLKAKKLDVQKKRSYVKKSAESVLRPEGSLRRWERLVKERDMGFWAGVKD